MDKRSLIDIDYEYWITEYHYEIMKSKQRKCKLLNKSLTRFMKNLKIA